MESATSCATPHAITRTISLRAAARALGKNPSTIARYVKTHPALNHGTSSRPKVDLEELRRHREANVNPFKSGSHAGRIFGEIDGAENGHADIPFATEYDRAYNAGKVLQQDLVDLAAQLSEHLATMTDPPEIVVLLETGYYRVLLGLVASLNEIAEVAPLKVITEAITLPREE